MAAATVESSGRGPLGESWSAWIALAIGVLAVSAHSAFAYGMAPLMKSILQDLGWSRSEYASAVNLRLLVLIAVVPFAGQLADRVGARLVLTVGAILLGTGIFAISWIQTIQHFYALAFWTGPAQACIGSVAASALVLQRFRVRRGLAIGILNGGDNLINSAVPLAAAYMLAQGGWRLAVQSLAGAYILLGGLIFVVLRSDAKGNRDRQRANVAASASTAERTLESTVLDSRRQDAGNPGGLPWRDSRFWLLVAAYVCVYAFITSVGIHFQAFQTDLGRSSAEAAQIYSLNVLIGAFGSAAFGWLAERSSARSALVVDIIGLIAMSVVLWTARSAPAFFGWAVVYGVFNAGAVALLALVLNELYGSQRIGRLMGVAMMFCMGGTVLGNQFSACIFDRFGSYLPVWQTYSALMVLALVPAVLLVRSPSEFVADVDRLHPRAM